MSTCGACGRGFETFAEVFSHPCTGLWRRDQPADEEYRALVTLCERRGVKPPASDDLTQRQAWQQRIDLEWPDVGWRDKFWIERLTGRPDYYRRRRAANLKRLA